ncbi:uncharacterized protein [Oncorhynchus clarkii lewisi]|uniref:uncharacterized protein isoform X1 n=1 Tax=Oncorhynchus clarkii lewisi TaxID=490388 RepID=UPI0039B8469C
MESNPPALQPKYWHPALRACKPRFCKNHYAEMEATLLRMYEWLLDRFSFLGVKPDCVYEEVLKVERHFLRSSKPWARALTTPTKTQPRKQPNGKQTRKTTLFSRQLKRVTSSGPTTMDCYCAIMPC